MTRTSTSTPGRLAFVDWLRGWAIVVMIEVHVFNSFLESGLRDSGWFRALNFLNGLVAPSFLFVSGFVFIVSSRRRLDELRSLGPSFRRQIKRVGTVWLIAYALHLPPAPLSQYFSNLRALDWRALYKVDVLHCICFTWLLLMASLILIRPEKLQRWWLLGSALAATALAPWMWSLELSPPVPAPIAAYLNDRLQSLFPLFPWSGFMLAGAFCASLYLGAAARAAEPGLLHRMGGAGLVLIAIGASLPPLAWLPGGASASWAADPRTFLLRLGIVLVLLWICWAYGRRREPRPSSLWLLMSRESLLVYVAHILVLFVPLWNGRSVAQIVGQSHGPLFSAVASLALIVFMALAARTWAARKLKPVK